MAGSNLAYIVMCRCRGLFWPTMCDMKHTDNAHPYPPRWAPRWIDRLVQAETKFKLINFKHDHDGMQMRSDEFTDAVVFNDAVSAQCIHRSRNVLVVYRQT